MHPCSVKLFFVNFSEILLCVAVSCMQKFVEDNWTGPLGLGGDSKATFISNKSALSGLSLDGETIYNRIANPHLLLLARFILTNTPVKSHLKVKSKSNTGKI